MHKIFNKFLIITSVAILLMGGYAYFSDGENAQAATSGSSALSSSAESSSPSAMVSTDDKITADTAFLVSLISLKKINIDTTIFANDAFNALVDNNVKLEPTPYGRLNPFAPIRKDTPGEVLPISPVTTNPPLQVMSKTASLYGTINNPTGVTSAYFEYGPTPVFGTKTAPATQSLVGTFVTNVTGLAPKTVYFYHAVAKVDGVLVYGETVSFFTN
jgi:hypothetical protein